MFLFTIGLSAWTPLLVSLEMTDRDWSIFSSGNIVKLLITKSQYFLKSSICWHKQTIIDLQMTISILFDLYCTTSFVSELAYFTISPRMIGSKNKLKLFTAPWLTLLIEAILEMPQQIILPLIILAFSTSVFYIVAHIEESDYYYYLIPPIWFYLHYYYVSLCRPSF